MKKVWKKKKKGQLNKRNTISLLLIHLGKNRHSKHRA